MNECDGITFRWRKKKSILFDRNSSWRPELPHFSSNTLACVTCSAETTMNIMPGWPAGSLKLKMSGFSLRIPLFPSAVLKPSIQDHWRFVMNTFLGVNLNYYFHEKNMQFVYRIGANTTALLIITASRVNSNTKAPKLLNLNNTTASWL